MIHIIWPILYGPYRMILYGPFTFDFLTLGITVLDNSLQIACCSTAEVKNCCSDLKIQCRHSKWQDRRHSKTAKISAQFLEVVT